MVLVCENLCFVHGLVRATGSVHSDAASDRSVRGRDVLQIAQERGYQES